MFDRKTGVVRQARSINEVDRMRCYSALRKTFHSTMGNPEPSVPPLVKVPPVHARYFNKY